MATVEVDSVYFLTNAYTLASKQLASNGDSIFMDDPSTANNHFWYLKVTDIDPYYRLHTQANGDSKPLDVYNDKGVHSTSVRFAASTRASGQYWRLDTWGDGTYRLSNNFTGVYVHLDIYADTLEPYLAEGDHTGQHWTFERYVGDKTGPMLSSTTSGLMSGTSTSTRISTPSSISTGSTPSAAPANESSRGSKLSTGAIVGIAVGGVVLLTLCICAIVYCLRRKPEQQSAELSPTTYTVQDEKQTVTNAVPVPDQRYQHPVELVGSTVLSPIEMPVVR